MSWISSRAFLPQLGLRSRTTSDALIVDLRPSLPDGANVDHVAFVTDRTSFDAFVATRPPEIEMGPAEMGGAWGQGHGTHLRDPSGARIELRAYRQ